MGWDMAMTDGPLLSVFFTIPFLFYHSTSRSRLSASLSRSTALCRQSHAHIFSRSSTSDQARVIQTIDRTMLG
jgi:hypothetical protein